MKIDNILKYFPEGYTPRSNQIEGLKQIEKALNKDQKFIILNAPTGSGKSVIAKTVGNIVNQVPYEIKEITKNYSIFSFNENGLKYKHAEEIEDMDPFGCYVLTTTKALQNQYDQLFKDSVILKGKANYQCAVDETCSVNAAPCLVSSNLKNKCWEQHVCPYYEARNRAIANDFSILNYSKFFNLPNHLKKRQIIICDECSDFENELVKHFSINIKYKHLWFLDIKIKKLTKDNKEYVIGWLNDLSISVNQKLKDLSRYNYDDKSGYVKINKLQNLRDSLKLITEHWNVCDFVCEKDGEQVNITPLKITPLTDIVFKQAKHVILMSATIINHKTFAKNLGIKDYSYIELGSTFDSKKSPIYCLSKYPLSYNSMDKFLPKLLPYINKILDAHKGQKGIIHTHNFKITEYIQQHIKDKRLLFREGGYTNEDILKEHQERKDDTVLVSPSLIMGTDLKGDLGQFQIIMKLPYPPLSNKRIKALFEQDKNWYLDEMLKLFIQASGRCTRDVNDEAVTYVLDGNIKRVLEQNNHVLPKHFKDRII